MKFSEHKNLNTHTGYYRVETEKDEWSDLLQKSQAIELKLVVVPGFRKGHVPVHLAKERINNGKILARAHQKFIKMAYDFMNQQENKKIKPYLSVKGFESEITKTTSNSCVVHFKFDLLPYANCKKWKEIVVEYQEPKVTNAEIQIKLTKLREEKAILEVKNKVVEKNDTVVIDFEGFIDDKPFEGGDATNYTLEIGSNSMIPGFEDGIIGMKPEQWKKITVQFPKEYHVTDLRNKKARFDIFLHEVKIKKVLPLDEQFVSLLNLPNIKTVRDLHDQVKQEILMQKAAQEKERNAEIILDKLFEVCEVKIPPSLVETELFMQKNSVMQKIKKDKINFKDYLRHLKKTEKEFFEELDEEAIDRLTLSFILKTIADAENINVDESEYQEFVQKTALQQNVPTKKIEEALFAKKEEVLFRIRNDKVWALICKTTVQKPLDKKNSITNQKQSVSKKVKPSGGKAQTNHKKTAPNQNAKKQINHKKSFEKQGSKKHNSDHKPEKLKRNHK